MKIAKVIEGGLTGVTTLSLIQEALHKIDGKAPQPFLHKSAVIKKLRKNSAQGGDKNKLYVRLAGELLSSAAYFGITGLGKKKNALLRGGVLGAAAGLATAFLNPDQEEEAFAAVDGSTVEKGQGIKNKILTVSLYTAGGLLAGAAIQHINKKTLRKLKRKSKKK